VINHHWQRKFLINPGKQRRNQRNFAAFRLTLWDSDHQDFLCRQGSCPDGASSDKTLKGEFLPMISSLQAADCEQPKGAKKSQRDCFVVPKPLGASRNDIKSGSLITRAKARSNLLADKPRGLPKNAD